MIDYFNRYLPVPILNVRFTVLRPFHWQTISIANLHIDVPIKY